MFSTGVAPAQTGFQLQSVPATRVMKRMSAAERCKAAVIRPDGPRDVLWLLAAGSVDIEAKGGIKMS